jgi:uncharacterized protein (DUF362 family)
MVLTDFTVVEAAVKMVREKGCEPLIVESDNIADTGDNRVRDSGLKAKLDEWGVKFLNLSSDQCVSHTVAGSEIMIPKTMLEVDYVVNLAKMKTCAHTTVTLGIKNLYGCFRRRRKAGSIRSSTSPALCEDDQTDMTVIDGLTCMGNGPVVRTRGSWSHPCRFRHRRCGQLCCRLWASSPRR